MAKKMTRAEAWELAERLGNLNPDRNTGYMAYLLENENLIEIIDPPTLREAVEHVISCSSNLASNPIHVDRKAFVALEHALVRNAT